MRKFVVCSAFVLTATGALGATADSALAADPCFGAADAGTATRTTDLSGKTTIQGTAQDETIIGTPGVDVIYGRGGDDRICGLEGEDRVEAGPGEDLVEGGSGNGNLYG